jgi:hypothetical protein
MPRIRARASGRAGSSITMLLKTPWLTRQILGPGCALAPPSLSSASGSAASIGGERFADMGNARLPNRCPWTPTASMGRRVPEGVNAAATPRAVIAVEPQQRA